MIVVPPPPPPSSSAAPAAVSALLPLSDAPPSLRAAPLNAIIQGSVAANNPGALIVQTAQGQLSLAVTLSGLKVGQQVTLTLQPGANGAQLLIQADRPPQPGVATVSDLLPTVQGAAQPLRPGAIVQAIVIRAPGSPLGEAPPVPQPGAVPSGALPNAAVPNGAAQPSTTQTGAVPVPAPALQGQAPVTPQAAATPAGAAQPSPPTTSTAPQTAPAPVNAQAAPAPQPVPIQNLAAPTVPPAGQSAPPPASAAPTLAPPAAASPATAAPAPVAGTAPAPPSASAPTPATPPPAPRADAAQTPPLLLGASNGDRIPLRIVSLLPSTSPAQSAAAAPVTAAVGAVAPAALTASAGAASAATLAPGNFTAAVVGASANGSAIVRAGAGLMTLEGVSAPVGSAVVLSPATPRPVSAPPIRAENAALQAALPGVSELISAANATGGPAQAAMQAIMPRLGPQMAAGMIFFMRALRTGDIADWLGKDARVAIERSGRAATMKKASAEVERIARSNEGGGEWSVYPVPLGVGGQRVEPIRLYVRHAEPDEEGGAKKGGAPQPTRFLIDLDLSRLGRIQLDGLARLPKLDLVVRSESQLNPAMLQSLKRLFADVTSARGIQGDMSFQTAPPIDPTVAAPARARSGIMV